MQFDPTDKLLTDAFAVIAKYDPALYARMATDDWRVSTDLMSALTWPGLNLGDFYGAMGSYGSTLTRKTTGETPSVFINPDVITEWSRPNRVPVALFAADIIVHEYRHVTDNEGPDGNDEPPAFRASSAWAVKLPAPYGARIKALSDKTLRATLNGYI